MSSLRYNLFLDDERMPSDVVWCAIGLGPWVIVRSYEEFRDYIKKNGIPHRVSFDHDLCDAHYQACFAGSHDYGPEKTGYDAAKWLVFHCGERCPFPDYTVHSMNPIGRENITSFIENARKAGVIQ